MYEACTAARFFFLASLWTCCGFWRQHREVRTHPVAHKQWSKLASKRLIEEWHLPMWTAHIFRPHHLRDWIKVLHKHTGTKGRRRHHNVLASTIYVDSQWAPLFHDCAVLARHREKDVCEMIEAQAIRWNGETCVSAASIDLLDKEAAFLKGAVWQFDQDWHGCAWSISAWISQK